MDCIRSKPVSPACRSLWFFLCKREGRSQAVDSQSEDVVLSQLKKHNQLPIRNV